MAVSPVLSVYPDDERAGTFRAGRGTEGHEEAIQILEKALEEIREFRSEYGDDEPLPGGHEIELLNGLLLQAQGKKPKSNADKLHEELEKAIQSENYEKAAALRDKLSQLEKHPPPDSSGKSA